MSKSKILFQLTGSIACFKACAVISQLVQKGFEVQTVCTAGAFEFIGAGTLEGLTGKPVFSNVHETGRRMDHISLAKWADLAIVCPATANTINRLANGLGDDPVGTLFLAYDLGRKPYLVAPAMNHQMLEHPATRISLTRLESWGVEILPTEEGRQACGDVGPGRLAEPELVLKRIYRALGLGGGVIT